jgi:hypothetical protein
MYGACASLNHTLQCLCARLSTRSLQLVIFVLRRALLFQLDVPWDGTGWCENSTRWKSCKRVQVRGRGA